MTREEQKQKRRQEILYVGLSLFIKKGYAATKIANIAEEANMSMGLLFHYFNSKEALLEELVQLGLEGTRLPLQGIIKEPLEFFKSFTEDLFKSMQQEPYVAQMFTLMGQVQRNEGIPENIRQLALEVNTIESCVVIIEEGQKKGSIRQGNALALSNTYWCTIQGIAEQYVLRPDIPLPEVEWIIDLISEKGR